MPGMRGRAGESPQNGFHARFDWQQTLPLLALPPGLSALPGAFLPPVRAHLKTRGYPPGVGDRRSGPPEEVWETEGRDHPKRCRRPKVGTTRRGVGDRRSGPPEEVGGGLSPQGGSRPSGRIPSYSPKSGAISAILKWPVSQLSVAGHDTRPSLPHSLDRDRKNAANQAVSAIYRLLCL